MIYRILVVVAWVAFCYLRGGIWGGVAGFVLFGFLSAVVFGLMDGIEAVGRAVRRPNVTTHNTLNVERLETGGAIKGSPDPTRPTPEPDEMWPAIIEVRRELGRKK